MHKLIERISKRSYEAAKRRGKDVTPEGCKKYLQIELNEYWDAIEAGKPTHFWRDLVRDAAQMCDADFMEMYKRRAHNTDADELADILITTATWIEAIHHKHEETGDPYRPNRDAELMLTEGPIQYVVDQLGDSEDRERLTNIIYLKLRYNDLRKD